MVGVAVLLLTVHQVKCVTGTTESILRTILLREREREKSRVSGLILFISITFELFCCPAPISNNSVYMADGPATAVYHVKM